MKKYLVLYKSSVPALEQMAKAGMDAWMTWAKKARPAIVDLGTPLGKPLIVATGDTGRGESKIVGFSILQADSSQAIKDLLKNHPHLKAPGSSIEVLESLPMPEMSQE